MRILVLLSFAAIMVFSACQLFRARGTPAPGGSAADLATAPDLASKCIAPTYTQSSSAVVSVSADGSMTVGSLRARGSHPVSTLIVDGVSADISDPNTDAYGASSDGTVVGGTTAITSLTSVQQAMRWTHATGWAPLGKPDGAMPCDTMLNSVSAVSGSGQYLVGTTETNLGTCKSRAYRWSQANGWRILEGSAPTDRRDYTAAYAVSDDGLIVAGVDYMGNATQQQACYWDASGAFHPIGPAGIQSKAQGVSHNGKYIVGESIVDAAGNGGAWLYSVADGTFQILGEMMGKPRPGASLSAACFAVSDDGHTAVCAHGPKRGSYQNAFIWKKGRPLAKLDTYFTAMGAMPTAWDQFSTVQSMSADATVFGGITATGYGYTGGFIARLSPCDM